MQLDWDASVPSRLRERAQAVTGSVAQDDARGLVQAAVALTRQVVQDQAGGRATALDLLVADALVTHALGTMADNPGELEARCLETMTAFAALVSP